MNFITNISTLSLHIIFLIPFSYFENHFYYYYWQLHTLKNKSYLTKIVQIRVAVGVRVRYGVPNIQPIHFNVKFQNNQTQHIIETEAKLARPRILTILSTIRRTIKHVADVAKCFTLHRSGSGIAPARHSILGTLSAKYPHKQEIKQFCKAHLLTRWSGRWSIAIRPVSPKSYTPALETWHDRRVFAAFSRDICLQHPIPGADRAGKPLKNKEKPFSESLFNPSSVRVSKNRQIVTFFHANGRLHVEERVRAQSDKLIMVQQYMTFASIRRSKNETGRTRCI